MPDSEIRHLPREGVVGRLRRQRRQIMAVVAWYGARTAQVGGPMYPGVLYCALAGWRSILVNRARPNAGLKIRDGHIDEVPGGGFGRPARGCYWELRWRGEPQWHAGVDPTTAETRPTGHLTGAGLRGRTCTWPNLRAV